MIKLKSVTQVDDKKYEDKERDEIMKTAQFLFNVGQTPLCAGILSGTQSKPQFIFKFKPQLWAAFRIKTKAILKLTCTTDYVLYRRSVRRPPTTGRMAW